MFVIQRCVKPPGFIFAARTYRLVLNDKGLYLIHIGRAMGPKVRADNAVSDALAQKMIGKISPDRNRCCVYHSKFENCRDEKISIN